ncbi:MAG: geranylgeranylglycerol-phosphate geranylgeranyltransferase [Bacteroidetes bacterium]|nr:geranylgeranylglycerol-phosphate geranylgeranyltransferase [Bacteroidota bacterium]
MIHFFRLIRITNLVIVALTMAGVAFYILKNNYFLKVDFNSLDFGLLVFSTVIIAAAGNMINDYFDIKADRINKPEKLIISKYMKKRWAIVLHWGLNAIAVLISVYLSWKYKSLLFVFIHILSMNLLWFYSTAFKKKLFFGNFVIALLTAMVPLLAVWFFKILNESSLPYNPFQPNTWSTKLDYSFIYFLTVCAFFQNLAREISKDIQDISGDKVIAVYSLPMKFGIQKTSYLVVLLLLFPIFNWFIYKIEFNIQVNFISFLFLITSAFINIICVVVIILKSDYPFRLVNALMKWSMLIGLITLYTNF